MGFIIYRMEIVGGDSSAIAFIDQWNSGVDSFEAHTSGSTGAPKSILLPRSDMISSARSTNDFFGISRSSVMLCPLSASYIAGKMMIVRALLADCKIIIEYPSNRPVKSRYGIIDLLPIVPSQAEWILDNPTPGTVIKNVIVGGAPMSPEIERRLVDAPFDCYATYGMTETCSHVALRRVGETFFTAMPGITFSEDTDHRLIIRSADRSFGSLLTNDVVELRDSSSFRWLGRFDNVIISGGVKLHPEEIEREIADLIPLPFYLIGEADRKWGTALILYIEGDGVDIPRLSEAIKSRLHPYKVPRQIRLLPRFCRTPSGKIKRILI